jgi:hypothetical protein
VISGHCPSTAELIRDWGYKVNLRCSCCGKPSLWEIDMKAGVYYLCSYCDVSQDLRKFT